MSPTSRTTERRSNSFAAGPRSECTVIAISAAATGLKQREYASLPYQEGVVCVDDAKDEEAEDFMADVEEHDLDF